MTDAAASSSSVSDETLSALSNEFVRLGRRREPTSSATILDASAFKILWLVVEHGPHTLRGLAEYLQLDQSTINRQVHAVISRGFVERYDDPDSHGMLIRATSAGETAYRSDAKARAEALRVIVDRMGEGAVADLAQRLAAFNDAIDYAAAVSLLSRS